MSLKPLYIKKNELLCARKGIAGLKGRNNVRAKYTGYYCNGCKARGY